LLLDNLKSAVARINPSIPVDVRDDAIRQIQRLNSPELVVNNESFHRMLTEGIKVTLQKDGNSRGDLVWLIDFNEPDNNDFVGEQRNFGLLGHLGQPRGDCPYVVVNNDEIMVTL